MRPLYLILALTLTGCGLANLNEALDNSPKEPAVIAPVDSPVDTTYPDIKPPAPTNP